MATGFVLVRYLLATGFVILFLFMEETNCHKSSIMGTESKLQNATESPVVNVEADSKIMNEKATINEPGTTDATIDLSYVPCRIYSGFSYGSNLV